MFRIYAFCALALAGAFSSTAQQQAADKIIAVVGNKVILQSELGTHIHMTRRQDPNISDTLECELFQNMLAEKLLVEQALRDSVTVDDAAVEAELDNRIRRFMQEYGSRERMEQYLGKTVYQIKDENRSIIKDALIAGKMREKLVGDIKVSPEEVKAFFATIKDEDKPFLPATVEMGQIIIQPEVDPELDKYAKDQLEQIRKDIVENGKDFGIMAGIYSQDPSTKDNGGELTLNRTEFDPMFTSAGYRLQPGEISPVFKSKFGYHIIKMIRRMGEEAQVAHILIRPEITTYDLQKSLNKLDTIKQALDKKEITFQTAVAKYSTDDASKMTGGMVYSQDGGTMLPIDYLDPQMALEIEKLKVGEYSAPQVFTDPQTGERSTRILYLKSRVDPHKANLKDDYNRIQMLTIRQKQMDVLMKWFAKNLPLYYIKLDDNYRHCSLLKDWYAASDKEKSSKR
jgi:peptidyl-prolyl cis-trans isomerase SurA